MIEKDLDISKTPCLGEPMVGGSIVDGSGHILEFNNSATVGTSISSSVTTTITVPTATVTAHDPDPRDMVLT